MSTHPARRSTQPTALLNPLMADLLALGVIRRFVKMGLRPASRSPWRGALSRPCTGGQAEARGQERDGCRASSGQAGVGDVAR
jgi:hypothetical protein